MNYRTWLLGLFCVLVATQMLQEQGSLQLTVIGVSPDGEEDSLEGFGRGLAPLGEEGEVDGIPLESLILLPLRLVLLKMKMELVILKKMQFKNNQKSFKSRQVVEFLLGRVRPELKGGRIVKGSVREADGAIIFLYEYLNKDDKYVEAEIRHRTGGDFEVVRELTIDDRDQLQLTGVPPGADVFDEIINFDKPQEAPARKGNLRQDTRMLPPSSFLELPSSPFTPDTPDKDPLPKEPETFLLISKAPAELETISKMEDLSTLREPDTNTSSTVAAGSPSQPAKTLGQDAEEAPQEQREATGGWLKQMWDKLTRKTMVSDMNYNPNRTEP